MKKLMKGQCAVGGFTLVELIMTMAIFSLVFLALVEVSLLFNTYFHTDHAQAIYEMRGRIVLDRITALLRNAETVAVATDGNALTIEDDGCRYYYWYDNDGTAARKRTLNLTETYLASGGTIFDGPVLRDVDKNGTAKIFTLLAARTVQIQFFIQEDVRLNLSQTYHGYKGIVLSAVAYTRNS